MTSKECRTCGVNKPLDEYPRRKIRKDGRDSHCNECKRIATAAWRAVNPERSRASVAAYARRNPDKVAARNRSYYERNRDRWEANRTTQEYKEKAKARTKG